MYENTIQFGSWDPRVLEHGTQLNVISSAYEDEYKFYLQDCLIGGREALYPSGHAPTTKSVIISLDLPYLYVGKAEWVLLTTSLRAIAPAIDCNQ